MDFNAVLCMLLAVSTGLGTLKPLEKALHGLLVDEDLPFWRYVDRSSDCAATEISDACARGVVGDFVLMLRWCCDESLSTQIEIVLERSTSPRTELSTPIGQNGQPLAALSLSPLKS